MAKKLYLAIWFVLVQVFVRKTRTFTSHGEVSWFVGCYNDSSIFQHSSLEPSHFVDHVTPFSCIRQCAFNESFKYAAVKNGSSCFCLSQVEEKNRLNDAFCNLSCHKSKNITCGGTNSSSVYSTAVPLIVALNLSLPNQVKANASVAAISELSIKRWSNEVSGLNRIREGNQTADSFSIQWFSERKVFNTILHTLKGNTTRTSSHLEFIVPGHHNVCVQARNLFSKLERCMFVDVVAPVKGLQLVAVFSEGTKLELLPSLLIPTVKTVHLKYLIMSGSRPEFTFDFGDGSSSLTVAKAVSGRIALECSCVTVSHVFQRCGNITINATASNSISRESVVQPAMVNVFIQSLEIDKGGRKDCMYVAVNVPKTLRTKIRGSKGCIVSYEWNFNDSSPNVITQGPTVSHTFSTLRRYYVTVIAHNEHGRREAVAEVCVRERLKGVVLEPEVSQLIMSTDEDTKNFHAKLRPELPGIGTVRFSFYQSDRDYPLTPGPDFPFSHNEKAGRYIVFAEAANKVSRISSNRIEVFVLDPIIKLSIHHDSEGTILRGKLTHLVARLGKGTNVTYYWDFGDGSQENTTSADVYHTFTRRDKYEVRVTASNAVSSEDAFMRIFVTDLPHCYPPEVSMIGNRERVNRSQEIRLEAYVTLNNCSKTKEVLYSWKVRNLSRRKPVQLDDVSFTEQVLILPPCMLEYGNHLFHLEVKVKGTFLSAGIKKYIKIVKSHLVAIIAGGTTKVVGRKNKHITMNASSSYDPDYPDEGHQNLRFRWSCHPLGRKDISCFNQAKLSGLNMSSAILTFQLDWLLADITHQFEVVVSKDSRNFSSFQIIYVHTERPHLLSANCPQCDKGHVNPRFPLVITGFCLSCPLINSNVTYKWRLYHVGDTKLLKEEDCPLTEPLLDDSSVNLNSGFQSTRKTLPTFPPTNSVMPATTRYEVTPTQQLTSKKETNYTTKPTATTFSRARFSSGLICQDPDQILGPTTSPPRKHPVWPGGGPGSGSGSGGGTGHGSGSGTGRGSGSGSGSGTGSGTGSSSGAPNFQQKTSQQKTTKIPPTQAHLNSTTVAPTTDDDDDPVVPPLETMLSPTYMPPSAKYLSSIISLDRRQLKLSAKQTTTGLGRQNFVLQGTFLRGGHTYMVSFKVFDGNTGQQGKASVFFNTSHILRCGVCSVTPDIGVAMETSFQLTCSRWLGNKPYTYNIRYSISGEGERFFVYSGFKDKVPFVLPAGRPLFSNTVQIYVTVADGQGSRRRIQPVRVEVKPQVVPEGVIMEEILLNQTVGNKLSLLQEARNEQGIQQFITALAISLNRLGSVRNVTSKFYLRVQIREKLLQGIQNLTVYDKNSALQTCLALQTLTKKPDELSVVSVETASKTLHKLGEMMKLKHKEVQEDWTVARELLSQEFIQSATRVTSNLLEASSLLVQRNSWMNKGNMLLRATEAAEELIKAKLSMQVLGEQSLQVTTQNIRVIATQRSSVSDFLFSIGDFKFHMPTNLEKQLNIASAANKGSCFGTMMTVYQENPFFSNMLHTTVGSLSISRCSGEEIQVRNLSSDILISIPHKNYWVEQHAENFTLKWKRKNIHVINQTENMLNQSLHIRLKPLSVLPPGFVVKLVVSTVEADSSSGNQNMHTITSSGEAIDLFLSWQQLINVSASVFAKVVLEDTAYYRIKSVKNGPKFDYLLSMQWMGCFYWNKHNKDWASDGCQLMEERTDKMIFCRCNHLTAFSGAFLRPPNSLKTQDLRDNEKFKQSPLTLVLVICILALYLLLLGFCVRADRYDKKKLGVIYLDDNTIASSLSQRLQISVQTGHWFGAGTSAGVYLIIHGDDHISDPIELKCAGKPLFQRSSCDVFVASIPKIFSNNIWKIHVWHDNKGEYPSWFLERIIIKDVNIGLKWSFDCNRWLAVDEEDGKVECELLPNTRPSITVKKSFSQHSAKSFVDYHLWFSLFGRPSYSRFTRVQRLSCCLSLLLSFLCVNIAWYHPRTEVHEVLGMLDISVESILVGVLCSIVVLPINLLWIFLFRYSRRSFRHRVKVYPVSERATDITELAPSSASVLDQSLETVLILKNIGGRRRWFQEAQQIDGVGDESLLGHPGDSLMRHPGEFLECSSDGTSIGYISGHDNLGADPTLPNASAGLVETCDFLAALAPSRKKHAVEFDKQSTYSVCVSTSASEGRGPYRSGVSLPHIFVYVAWFGCLTTTAVAGLFTIWYGVSFGWDLSIHWLQSLLFSLLESLLFSQPILVLLFIFYMACKSQTKQESEEGDEGFEDLSSSALHEIHYGHLNQGFEEEAIRDEVDPALALRRKQRHLKYLKPPTKSKLAEAREKRVRNKALWDYTVDLLVFILFLVVTCLLVASVTSPDVYHLNQAIKKTFVTSNYSTPTNNIVDAWEKISATLNKNSGLPSYTPFTILLHDTQSLLFGRTKVTQYKTPFVTVCHEIPAISGNQTVNVNNRFSGNASTGLCHADCHAGEGAWISMELNQTRAESLKQLKHITDSQWINTCTREIFVEFAIYTPFLRAISAATLSVKASLTGTPKCQLELNTFPAFFKSAGFGYFVTVCKLLFVGIFLYLLQHEFFLALKLSTDYFSNFWRVFQLLIVALSSACLVLFIRWSISLYALLREVETTSQTHVFYYAKLVSWSQEALLVSYSLLLFLLFVRSLYLLSPFRFVVRLGRVLAAAVVPLLACGVVIVIVVMVFAHPGYLLFGRLHSSFKSFGEACLLVSSFFRLKGVSRFQEPALEEHPVLFSFYFALFLVGFCIVMRGTTAAVFVYGMPHFRKRRNSLLSNVLEEFIRNKLHLLKKKTRRRQRRDYTSDEDEDEEEDEEVFEEFEEYEELEGDSSFPMEHVLDELDDQIEEMTWRVRTLFGSDSLDNLYSSDDLLSCLSLEDSEDDVEYLYRADRQSLSSGSGYESDHSNMSPAKWQFSSSSSHDITDEGSRLDQYSRPPTFALGGAEVHGLGQSSCSSVLTVHPCEGELARFDGTSRRKGCFVNDSASPNMCTEHIIGMDRELWDVPGACGGTNVLRDIVMRDSDLHEGVLRDRYGGDCSTVSSAKAASQELSSSSGYSFRIRSRPDKEPIKPKAMYGVTRGHSLKGSTAFPELRSLSPRPSTCGEGSNSEGETNSSPKLEAGVRTTRSHSRKGKSLFRSSVVYPCQEGLRLGRSPPLPHRAANRAESGSDSGVQSAWGLAPSISERGFSMNRDPDGLISDISMNRRLGTEIRNETNDLDTPNTSV